MPEIKFENGKYNIVDVLVAVKATQSRSEAKRVVNQGGVKFDGKKVESFKEDVTIENEHVLRVGKRKFYKLIAKN